MAADLATQIRGGGFFFRAICAPLSTDSFIRRRRPRSLASRRCRRNSIIFRAPVATADMTVGR